MKLTIKMATLILLSTIIYPITLQASFITDVMIDPVNPTSEDFITANIGGMFPATNYDFTSDPVAVIRNNNVIEISLFTVTAGPIGATIVIPYTVPASIGLLQPDDYSLIATAYLDGAFNNSIATSFSVSAVPIPPALMLFASGLAGLIFTSRVKK